MSAAPHDLPRGDGEDALGEGEAASTPDPTIARAEELVDRMGERVGQWLSQLGHSTQKALARAREEAEDIWAEAQHLRRNGGV
jgi:hypothetical protein